MKKLRLTEVKVDLYESITEIEPKLLLKLSKYGFILKRDHRHFYLEKVGTIDVKLLKDLISQVIQYVRWIDATTNLSTTRNLPLLEKKGKDGWSLFAIRGHDTRTVSIRYVSKDEHMPEYLNDVPDFTGFIDKVAAILKRDYSDLPENE